MSGLRRIYYDLFSRVYDSVIRLHSRDIEGSLRSFIAERTDVSTGDRVLDLCTGTGSVAGELCKRVGEGGLVVGLDFSSGMLRKANEKARRSPLNHLHLVQANASQLPFQNASFHGVTCSHAFYELKGTERTKVIEEVGRILKRDGRFCLMEHAKPETLFPRLLFYVRLLFLGSRDARQFLMEEGSILGERFENITKVMSPSGKSKLIHGDKGG